MSVLVYVMLIGMPFLFSGAHAKMAKVFGPRPLGFPVEIVYMASVTALYLPFPWVFLHVMRLAFQARDDGRMFGLWYLLTVGSYRPEMRRSQVVCLGGIIYLIAACCALAAYS